MPHPRSLYMKMVGSKVTTRIHYFELEADISSDHRFIRVDKALLTKDQRRTLRRGILTEVWQIEEKDLVAQLDQ